MGKSKHTTPPRPVTAQEIASVAESIISVYEKCIDTLLDTNTALEAENARLQLLLTEVDKNTAPPALGPGNRVPPKI